MASATGAPPFQFFISDDDKEAMVAQLVPQTIYAMERMATIEEAPLADDYVDMFARVIAVMLAADTNLDTPQKQRLGAETVASHVLRHLTAYRAAQEEHGGTIFASLLAAYEIPDVIKKGWEDS